MENSKGLGADRPTVCILAAMKVECFLAHQRCEHKFCTHTHISGLCFASKTVTMKPYKKEDDGEQSDCVLQSRSASEERVEPSPVYHAGRPERRNRTIRLTPAARLASGKRGAGSGGGNGE